MTDDRKADLSDLLLQRAAELDSIADGQPKALFDRFWLMSGTMRKAAEELKRHEEDSECQLGVRRD